MGLISNGTTIFDSGSMAAGFGGSLNFISSQTASSSTSVSFTSGIDSSYDNYIFYFVNIHPQNDDAMFTFNMSTDGGSNYNVTKTTTFIRNYQTQGGGANGLGYLTDEDLAQSTGYQTLSEWGYNSAESCSNGFLNLYNPSSTTFIKHFTSNFSMRRNYTSQSHAAACNLAGGYANTTSAINAVSFKYESGNIDSGQILLFGIN